MQGKYGRGRQRGVDDGQRTTLRELSEDVCEAEEMTREAVLTEG